MRNRLADVILQWNGTRLGVFMNYNCNNTRNRELFVKNSRLVQTLLGSYEIVMEIVQHFACSALTNFTNGNVHVGGVHYHKLRP